MIRAQGIKTALGERGEQAGPRGRVSAGWDGWSPSPGAFAARQVRELKELGDRGHSLVNHVAGAHRLRAPAHLPAGAGTSAGLETRAHRLPHCGNQGVGGPTAALKQPWGPRGAGQTGIWGSKSFQTQQQWGARHSYKLCVAFPAVHP